MIYLIVFVSILLGYGDDVFNSLYNDSNWNLVYTKDNGLSVYNKKIDSIPIKAIKVTYIDTVDIDTSFFNGNQRLKLNPGVFGFRDMSGEHSNDNLQT